MPGALLEKEADASAKKKRILMQTRRRGGREDVIALNNATKT
jgi:hypothetical protein